MFFQLHRRSLSVSVQFVFGFAIWLSPLSGWAYMTFSVTTVGVRHEAALYLIILVGKDVQTHAELGVLHAESFSG